MADIHILRCGQPLQVLARVSIFYALILEFRLYRLGKVEECTSIVSEECFPGIGLCLVRAPACSQLIVSSQFGEKLHPFGTVSPSHSVV